MNCYERNKKRFESIAGHHRFFFNEEGKKLRGDVLRSLVFTIFFSQNLQKKKFVWGITLSQNFLVNCRESPIQFARRSCLYEKKKLRATTLFSFSLSLFCCHPVASFIAPSVQKTKYRTGNHRKQKHHKNTANELFSLPFGENSVWAAVVPFPQSADCLPALRGHVRCGGVQSLSLTNSDPAPSRRPAPSAHRGRVPHVE